MQAVWRPLVWALVAAVAAMVILMVVVVRYVLPPPTHAAATPAYTIGVWEGQVAVFEGADSYPKQVFDVAVSTLPEDLRRQVEQGVAAENEAQLSVLLEDYTG